MKTYVHNYVFDVGQYLAYQERMGVSPTGKHAQPTIEATVPVSVQAAPEEAPEEAPVLEERPVEEIHSKTTNNFTVIPENEVSSEYPEEIVPKEKKPRKKKRASNVVLLIVVILLLLGFGVLAYYFVYLPLLGQPSTFTDGSSNAITEFLEGLFS